MKTIKIILTAIGVTCILSSCVSVDSLFGEQDSQISSVESQALQTREYDATEDQAFSAVVSVFQDCGYQITSADKATGLVQAKTVSDAKILMVTNITRVEYQNATAFIEKIGKDKVKIRVNLVKYVSATSPYGGSGEKEMTRTKPELYQEIFTKIDQALFLKKNM